jgi:hypothetical protein
MIPDGRRFSVVKEQEGWPGPEKPTGNDKSRLMGNERMAVLLKEYTFKHWDAYYTK